MQYFKPREHPITDMPFALRGFVCLPTTISAREQFTETQCYLVCQGCLGEEDPRIRSESFTLPQQSL